MKPHKILKTFNGSQDGHHTEAFIAGTVRDISDSLAAIVVKEAWAEPLQPTPEDRDTKVIESYETKPEPTKFLKKKR
jgi:hypothetical protein